MSFNVDEGGKAQEMLTHEAMPDGLDVYEDRIYWTDMGTPGVNDGAVFRAKFDGSDVKTVVPKGNGKNTLNHVMPIVGFEPPAQCVGISRIMVHLTTSPQACANQTSCTKDIPTAGASSKNSSQH